MFNPKDLTVMDYFAGQALVGLLASADRPHSAEAKFGPEALAKAAYEMATAMLKERERNA